MLLFFGAVFPVFFASCNFQSTTNQELESLKNDLFKNTTEISELPIYADPPTSDYNDVKKGVFHFQIDSIEIEKIRKYRKELEPLILEQIRSGYSWVYLAAYLHYENAVPKIKDELLKCDKFYGWEGGDYSGINRYLNDEQYCYQLAYISAIEYITGKPISKAITLTNQEISYLKGKAEKCNESNKQNLAEVCYGKWLLEKLNKK